MEQSDTQAAGYQDALRWIFDRINYERIRPRTASGHFRLERTAALLDLIGAPHESIPAIHIAGTKGKGSTAAMIDAALRRSGVRSGLYTSPHIEVFEERMRVAGRMPAADEIVDLVSDLRRRLKHAPPDLQDAGLTYFEVATLLAWMYFDRQNAEIVVLETGLGGRLDCTNVCRPLFTLITSIGLDHTHILGDTIQQIAAEKAGILKPGIPVLTSCRDPVAQQVIQARATELDCPLEIIGRDFEVSSIPSAERDTGDSRSSAALLQQIVVRVARSEEDDSDREASQYDLAIPLSGRHQADNAALALRTCQHLQHSDDRLTDQSIAAGLREVDWPLRFETVAADPRIILDVAHNPDSMAAFCQTLMELQPGEPRVLIFASSQDKDHESMLKILIPHFEAIVLTEYQENPRTVSCATLLGTAKNIQKSTESDRFPQLVSAATPTKALQQARDLVGESGTICGTGSFFLASELQQVLRQETVAGPA